MAGERPLWERQAWDTPTSFDRFQRFYLAQTPPRSLNEAYRRYRAEKWPEKGQEMGKGIDAPGGW